MLAERLLNRLRIGIGVQEVDASRFDWIMLLTALPPAPPTPITVIRGVRFGCNVGTFKFKVMLPSTSPPSD